MLRKRKATPANKAMDCAPMSASPERLKRPYY
jgi:hypothetical protein